MLPTLLLPGLMCDARVWRGVIEALPDHDLRAVNGYGDARSLQDMARRVLADAPPRFMLAGHSMGARVALEIYRIAPERVARLALLDTGVHAVTAAEPAGRYALLQLGRDQGAAALADRWLPPMMCEHSLGNSALMAELRAMVIEAGVGQFEAQIHALLTRPDLDALLPRVTAPTLVAVGVHDAWSPPAQHEQIVAALPKAALVVFEAAGHMAPSEAPHAVASALRDWIEGRTPP